MTMKLEKTFHNHKNIMKQLVEKMHLIISSQQRCSSKKGDLKNFADSQRNTCARVYLLKKRL